MSNKFHGEAVPSGYRRSTAPARAVPPITYPRKARTGNSISKLKIGKRNSIKNGATESPTHPKCRPTMRTK
ncbi:hypothetical protein Nepgr_007784 [Nepenthes gracilis]|uniref:Uncharacterized protein n=1 Tax=Nepenthes gracilis TaxID=150966 RepID=A0AAD3S7S6_NEPGR|nr:hypothetical protein Nepgr_007784 [Nepenthes gracilis]